MEITVCDVGPRDGLQNETAVLDPAVRAGLASRLAAAGVPRVEAASFVSAERVPQMAGAEDVAAALEGPAEWSGLVLNVRGWERLRATALARVNVTLAATESFNRRNGNRSLDEALVGAEEILRAADLPSTATLSVAFGCPFEGEVDPGRVVELAGRLAGAGAGEVVLADTIGVATPGRVRALVERTLAAVDAPVGGHFHDTRHTGVANAWAAVEAGATVLDASVGGLGGCPFAPRATGNVATEDVVFLLEREGVSTGIDLDALVAVAGWISAVLGRELPGGVSRAGPFPAK